MLCDGTEFPYGWDDELSDPLAIDRERDVVSRQNEDADPDSELPEGEWIPVDRPQAPTI